MIHASTYKLLSLSDKKEWSYSLEKLPEQMQDVFFSPEYDQIYKKMVIVKLIALYLKMKEILPCIHFYLIK